MSPLRLSARGACGVVLAALAAALSACRQAPPTTRPAGHPSRSAPFAELLHDWVRCPPVVESERELPALRIVSAAPNVTEMCCALGLRPLLVGRTRYCRYPPEIRDVPAIGALIDVNVERLLELKPDLILVSGASRALTDRLGALGLRFEAVPDTSFDDLFAAIRQIGELTGRPRTAERLCAGIRADLEAIRTRTGRLPAARVLWLIGTLDDPPRPPYVAGPGSFYHDLLRLAGQRNAVGKPAPAFGTLSLEYISQADPDVIIELDPDGSRRPGGDADACRAWARVGALRAVAHRRVHVLTGPEHYLLGPRVAYTYAELCRVLSASKP